MTSDHQYKPADIKHVMGSPVITSAKPQLRLGNPHVTDSPVDVFNAEEAVEDFSERANMMQIVEYNDGR